jgi:hypothetical protein
MTSSSSSPRWKYQFEEIFDHVCIDANDQSYVLRNHPDNYQEGARNLVITNINHLEDPNVPQRADGRTSGSRRLRMTQHLELAGIRRPAYAGKNSRQ